MNNVKVKLSKEEFNLMLNANFILTKNNIIQKVNSQFSYLHGFYESVLKTNKYLPKQVINSNVKIAKGEQYLGLPWIMMDYPKVFSKEHIFAIRTFFWWGNFLSITLHLSGVYLSHYKYVVENLLSKNDNSDWMFCVNKNQWHQHFEADNYQPLNNNCTKNIDKLSFIKLAKKIPLQKWDDSEIFFQHAFIELINAMHPNDGKVLLFDNSTIGFDL